jgi:putative endonuclease
MGKFYVYVLASKTGTLYTGVTNDLERRVREHKAGDIAGFTKKYNVNMLVYYEEFEQVYEAIEREKQIKAFRREKKDALVNEFNSSWEDLAKDWD